MRKSLDKISYVVLTIAALGLAVRLTVRDAWPVSAWVYYFFGLPAVLVALFLIGAFVSLLAGRTSRFACAALLSLAVGGAWWATSRYSNPCAADPESIRILSWNVSRLRTDRGLLLNDIKGFDADVILLTEGGNNNVDAFEFWRSHFPEYELVLPGGGIVAMFRGTIESSALRQMSGISSYAQFQVVVGGRRLRAVVVDLDASPRFDKRLLVPRVFELALEGAETPLIVAGDFNTPAGSPAFASTRQNFRHAFESSGSGMLATWPADYPITAIDHVWTGPGVTPLCTTLHTSTASDHRAVIADVML